MLGYEGGAPLALMPLGLAESTRYLGYMLDASGCFADKFARIHSRVREDCAAVHRAGRSVAEASTLLRGFAGGSTRFYGDGRAATGHAMPDTCGHRRDNDHELRLVHPKDRQGATLRACACRHGNVQPVSACGRDNCCDGNSNK